MHLIIKNARLISQKDNLDEICDILCESGKIKQIGEVDESLYPQARRLDASGLCLAPGMLDLMASATEPECVGAETLSTMAQAAVKGGFTTVCAHTRACTRAQVDAVRERSEYTACDIIPAICATSNGELLSYGELNMAGASVIYDADPIENPLTMRNAMFRARKYKMLLISFCADRRLYSGGIIREGVLSRVLDTSAIPVSAETTALARDILLAAESGTRLHIPHISTARSVEIIRTAKAMGADITCSTDPHYFALTCSAASGYNTLAKVEPPLGEKSDLEEIILGLSDGTIDAIASGHVPVPNELKAKSMVAAEFGISSLETALSVCLTYLYHMGGMSISQVLHKLTSAPAELLGVECGRLQEGAACDFVLFDPDFEYTLERKTLISMGKNTPFDGIALKGKVCYTIKDSRIVYQG